MTKPPVAVLLLAATLSQASTKAAETPEQQAAAAAVGREIFQDTRFSNPVGQSCMSCHVPQSAFADSKALSTGAVHGREGRRNATSLMYAALIPNFSQEDILEETGEQIWVWQGGLFQDGSSRTLYEQVKRPFFDHAEMNVCSPADLAAKLRAAPYARRLRGDLSDEDWANDGNVNQRCYRALVEFLKEPMFRPFDARIDDYLAGSPDALSEAEKRGLEIFKTKAKCADCHLLIPGAWPKPLLSDYGYDNLGAPSHGPKDPGLGGHTGVAEEMGRFRAPTLRNVSLTAPYLHNGSIATLREVVEFYNKRDEEPGRWGKTDFPETVNHEDSGKLGLTDQEIDDLVALMDAFTDRSLLEMRKANAPFPVAPSATPDSWKMRAYFPDWNHAVPPLPPLPARPYPPTPPYHSPNETP
ncbi:c-type cytochrome [Luteolibacter yonseiensis]|uniref:C-type cytochrome n=1 Tax=Luteolibacter yonseiensis TaxID=1144680 RepID=A0A934RAL5_9BACT|nr:cytochrome c peroxidase [Luteolibacter yonseiensis]MBK1818059.1 c-type cytochrome [Luteolibacter yonseiensis]